MTVVAIPPASDTAAWVSRSEVAELAELIIGLPHDLDDADPAVLGRLHRDHGIGVGVLWPGCGPERVGAAVRALVERRRLRAVHDATAGRRGPMCAREPAPIRGARP